MTERLDVKLLRQACRRGEVRVSNVISEVHRRIAERGTRPVWIQLCPANATLARAAELERHPHKENLPLYGIPFAVKDNIDVAGMPTTAGCPSYAYVPEKSATVVERLIGAGAILIGKTNLDQFATGLVGTRSPYGACSSVFDQRYISGGSSSGSAVAVASGLVSFALGTDTAGSGRVPAAFNNLLGLKPTRGAISAAGVVPACRTLDCVSILAHNSEDAAEILQVCAGFDSLDPFSRMPPPEASRWNGIPLRFGVPPRNQLEFFGDAAAMDLYRQAITCLAELGGEQVEIDFTPFRAVAELLYSGPWVAERLAAIGDFAASHSNEMDPVVAKIITSASRYSAVESWLAQYRLAELRRKIEPTWEQIDILFLPTTATIYTIEAIKADPVALNANLGYYTNFVNLLDLAAVAVPAGFRPNGLPFGISIIGQAWTESMLLSLAGHFERARDARIPPVNIGVK